ncbi:MAG: Cu(I)-responsive transcriptional regulator [Pseudomonadota bacterium]
MNIGTIAKKADLPIKTVRYYADIGLVSPSGRSDAGYRIYGEMELNKLRFVRSARSFGFTVEECRELLGLYEDRDRSSRDVKRMALQRISEIEDKMAELQTLHDELSRLASSCHGDDRADCPILTGLSR